MYPSSTTDAALGWPPALERVLRVWSIAATDARARAATALEVVLRGVMRSTWPEVAWSASRLTGDGFPVEFSFVSADDAIRYAAEVAGPEVPESDRLAHAQAALAALGAPVIPDETLAAFRHVQQAGSLRFGAWMAGRHGAEGDRFKVYVEAPRSDSTAADGLVRRLVGSEPLLSASATSLRMIGFQPASSRTELYFRAETLAPWQIGRLLRRLDLGWREEELTGLLADAYGCAIDEGLPSSHAGFSIAVEPHTGPLALSVILVARSVFGGGDRDIRRRLLQLGEARGWDWRTYRSVSQPLADRWGHQTAHGMVTITAATQGPVTIAVGLRPPEERL